MGFYLNSSDCRIYCGYWATLDQPASKYYRLLFLNWLVFPKCFSKTSGIILSFSPLVLNMKASAYLCNWGIYFCRIQNSGWETFMMIYQKLSAKPWYHQVRLVWLLTWFLLFPLLYMKGFLWDSKESSSVWMWQEKEKYGCLGMHAISSVAWEMIRNRFWSSCISLTKDTDALTTWTEVLPLHFRCCKMPL